MTEKPIIGITTGDPGGIGPEISLKAAVLPAVLSCCRPVVFGGEDILRRTAERIGLRIALRRWQPRDSAGPQGEESVALR